MNNKVGIIAGSASDLPLIKKTTETLEKLKIDYDITIASAHRTPDKVSIYAKEAENKYSVIIAAAGYAAHLGGVVSAYTNLPVIGIPINSSPLLGIDALLSTAQMPAGVPIATVSIGEAGAVNSAVLAARIISLFNSDVKEALNKYKQDMVDKIEKADADLQR